LKNGEVIVSAKVTFVKPVLNKPEMAWFAFSGELFAIHQRPGGCLCSRLTSAGYGYPGRLDDRRRIVSSAF